MKTEIINFNDFIKGDNCSTKRNKTIEFFDRNKGLIMKVCLVSGAVILGFGYEHAFASTGLEGKAKELYFGKFIGVAKWIIVGKGGWDTINKMLKEDFDGAKRCFLQYLVIFAVLLGLPYGLDQVESVFQGL